MNGQSAIKILNMHVNKPEDCIPRNGIADSKGKCTLYFEINCQIAKLPSACLHWLTLPSARHEIP